MDWWRNIKKELEIIDLQQVIDKDIFSPQGSRPLPRKRALDNPVTSRDPVMGFRELHGSTHGYSFANLHPTRG